MRRSPRTPTPTYRALQYQDSITPSTPRLPHDGDVVKVHWNVQGGALWWPATILAVHNIDHERQIATASILYHTFKEYGCEDATVLFQTGSSPSHRLVSSTEDTNLPSSLDNLQDICSWAYITDDQPADFTELEGPQLYNVSEEVTIRSEKVAPRRSQRTVNSKSTATATAALVTRPTTTTTKQQHLTSPNSTPPSRIGKEKRLSKRRISATSITHTTSFTPAGPKVVQPPTSASAQFDSTDSMPHQIIPGPTSPAVITDNAVNAAPSNDAAAKQISPLGANGDINESSHTMNTFHLHDSLPSSLQRSSPDSNAHRGISFHHHSSLAQFQSVVPSVRIFSGRHITPEYQFSAAATTILLRLKWSLLTRLEKPLSNLRLSDMHTHGMASHTITTRCDCDSAVFADICKLLARRHGLVSSTAHPSIQSPSRVRFFPDYHRTQSRSTGTDKLIVSFSTLVDVMDILGLRDEDDYERVLSKEKKSDNEHFLQTFGTIIHIPNNDEESMNPNSTCSIITSSDVKPFLRLFIGSGPCKTISTSTEDAENGETTPETPSDNSAHPFNSLVLEQDCRHFSLQKQCYMTSWRSSRIKTFFYPLNEEVCGSTLLSEPDPSTSFMLKWTRMKTPSTKKWSRDVQETRSSSPGHLLLSLPVIYTSSRSNFNAMSKLLDDNIEFLLHQRQSIQHSLEE